MLGLSQFVLFTMLSASAPFQDGTVVDGACVDGEIEEILEFRRKQVFWQLGFHLVLATLGHIVIISSVTVMLTLKRLRQVQPLKYYLSSTQVATFLEKVIEAQPTWVPGSQPLKWPKT